MTHRLAAAPGDPYRYGVYLRPDPATCTAVTTLTTQLRAQYGLASAGAFPPHATLAGSEHICALLDTIIAAITEALAGCKAFPVHNVGIRPLGVGLVYDIHHLADGTTPNHAFMELARAVDQAIKPLASPAPNPAEHRFSPDTFQAHISLASHDLYVRPDLRAEVEEFVRGIPVTHPESFLGDTIALYRTRSDDWAGRWWRTLTWDHVHTWRLPQ